LVRVNGRLSLVSVKVLHKSRLQLVLKRIGSDKMIGEGLGCLC
jgi:hypothetical protein